MEKTLQEKAEQLTAEVKAAQAKATAAEAEVAKLKSENAELKTSINNLDETAKSQEKAIEQLRIEVKASKVVDFKTALRQAFEEKKEAITKLVAEKADKFDFTLELKSIDSIGSSKIVPNNFFGVNPDNNIVGAAAVPNVFVASFGYRPRSGAKLAWLEGTTQSGAGYVAELAQNTAKSDVALAEKSRKFAKIATFMQISTEIEDWYNQLFNYCLNEGVRLIEAKIDAEIAGGDGHDTNHPTDVYGIKGQATAFSALAAHAVPNANVADVIMDAADQVAKNGYNANVAFVTWPLYRQLKSAKDANGNYLFDQVKGLLNGIQVKPTGNLSTGEIIVADSSCVEVYAGNSYELEMIRNGAYDAYDVYFRKAVQVKVATEKKKGLVYVADATTAIAALAPSV